MRVPAPSEAQPERRGLRGGGPPRPFPFVGMQNEAHGRPAHAEAAVLLASDACATARSSARSPRTVHRSITPCRVGDGRRPLTSATAPPTRAAYHMRQGLDRTGHAVAAWTPEGPQDPPGTFRRRSGRLGDGSRSASPSDAEGTPPSGSTRPTRLADAKVGDRLCRRRQAALSRRDRGPGRWCWSSRAARCPTQGPVPPRVAATATPAM